MKHMERKRGMYLGCFLLCMTLQVSAQDSIISTFNSENVILPSAEYTPEDTYQAMIWVYSSGMSYNDTYYNLIWAVPEDDADGHQWYEVDYSPNSEWSEQTSPFSNDEYYNGMKAYQYIATEIMGDFYMRRTFTLSEEIEGTVFLSAGHDDAPAEWYINGELVYSVEDGWENELYVLLTDEQKELIKTDGTENVFAVHVHQNWGGAYADCGLYAADMSISHPYLTTVANGTWDCFYYILNYNEDVKVAEAAGWASRDEGEEDWIYDVGPFSNDENMFYITEWPSSVRPILIRRHFKLTSEDLADIDNGDVLLTCSYDEDPKVYVNGTLIWSTTGWNDNDYEDYTLSDEQKALLVEGDNVLAVSLMQGDGGGHIDYGLSLTTEYVSTDIPSVSVRETEIVADNRVYNLSGQCIGTSTDNMAKGIYIVNGKKYLKK